jgi:hypothetical protein
MNFPKVVFALTVLALSAASAASVYSVKLYDPVSIGATQLKAGEYTVEMKGDKAVFKSGKTMVEVPATLGATEKKNDATTLLTSESKLREIDLGGTKEKIVFSPEVQSTAGTK